jgi:CheY-like chemotaxis protein
MQGAIDGIRQAMTAALRASELTRQMLAYSGKATFVIERLDLGRLVEESVPLLGSCIAKLIRFETKIAGNLPSISADRTQMQQIVLHLITNATEAIGEQVGSIVLSVGIKDYSADELRLSRIIDVPNPGRYVFIEVEDTGCGMSKETLECAFDPFFTTKTTGRGLGMSAILGIVRAHQGAIFVTSEREKGTTIRVAFAAMAEAVSVEATQDAPRLDSCSSVALEGKSRKTILLVDDEDAVRMVCERMLERLGWSVRAVANGSQALEIFTSYSEEIACILLDLSMPEMSGVDVLKEVRLRRPDVPVIIASGYASDSVDLREVPHAGPTRFLQKPYAIQTLKETLDRLLSS